MSSMWCNVNAFEIYVGVMRHIRVYDTCRAGGAGVAGGEGGLAWKGVNIYVFICR